MELRVFNIESNDLVYLGDINELVMGSLPANSVVMGFTNEYEMLDTGEQGKKLWVHDLVTFRLKNIKDKKDYETIKGVITYDYNISKCIVIAEMPHLGTTYHLDQCTCFKVGNIYENSEYISPKLLNIVKDYSKGA